MKNLSEKETREQYIDKELEKQGWHDSYIKTEVNSLRSDFNTKDYKEFDGNIERGKDRFIDYLLLDQDNTPLAIIEAKRTSISVEKGEIQAKTYQEDIKKQTGKIVPFFLTNGKSWYFVDEKHRKRKISVPFRQKDMHRRKLLFEREKEPSKVKINRTIVDRNRSVEAVKTVLEYFEKGHRSALLTMATGTGKTRVAMAIIDALIKSGYVQKVLFVVDRIPLAHNAKEEGFKEFFKEPVCELNVEGFSESQRLFVSTVQTLTYDKNKSRRPMFEKFGSSAFDLIIFDEAHRSFYDKQHILFDYFDCLKLGLTATPSKEETRDTLKLFDCENPTYNYEYDDAVEDKVLVPYVAEIIGTEVLTKGIMGKKLSKDLQQALKEQEEDPEKTELPGARFERVFTDDKTNELIVREFMDRCYKSAGLPCKSLFFCASVKHAEALKDSFDRIYPHLAKEVRIITSDRTRYMDEVRRFKKDSTPRIVLSVGVLDTGVNIPEIMNLVFVKPVFSTIRFWQMLGRGTRNLDACKNKDWLPLDNEQHIKDDFLILDFKFGDHSNVEYHKLNLSKKLSVRLDSKTRIFCEQVDLLKKDLDENQRKVIEKEIRRAVKDIDKESFMVREKLGLIKKVVSEKYDLKEHIEELKKEIAPLLIYSKSENSKVYAFISKCIKLFDAISEKDNETKSEIEEFVRERLENIWEKQLDVIRAKDEEIKKVFQEKFWEELTFEDVDFLIKGIAPLMVYYEPTRKKMLRINAPDITISSETIKHERKENKDLQAFLENNPLIKKIKQGGVTPKELTEIETKLSNLNPTWTINNIQNIMKTDFIVFLRSLIELKDLPDPEEMIKREFDKHVMSRNEHYNAKQLKFLRLLKEVFVRAKHIELKNFAEHPLTEERPLDIFQREDLLRIVEKCNKLKFR